MFMDRKWGGSKNRDIYVKLEKKCTKNFLNTITSQKEKKKRKSMLSI